MKPGNLQMQGAKSGGRNRKMRKRSFTRTAKNGARFCVNFECF